MNKGNLSLNNSKKMTKRILLAEDDAGIIEVVKIILEDHGFNVDVADNFKSIEELISKSQPGLIFLDIFLSGEDGRHIAKKLKADPKTMGIPIIMLSANNETEKIAKEVGADGFLAKPFDIDDLIQIAQKYI